MTEGRDQLNEQESKGETAQPQDAAEQRTSRSRRRLIKAGLLASPLLVTLRSRPLYAQSSLGSMGINYGLYVQNQTTNEWVPARVNNQGDVVEDPNGPDRRPDTGDEPKK